MEDIDFSSRIDIWLILAVVGAPFFVIVQGLYFMPDEPVGKYIAVGIGVFLLVLLPVAVFPCRYTLAEDHLKIQCGRFKQKIPYVQITRIEPSSSWLSAPALSLRRIEINFGSESQLISPRDRDKFIVSLKARMSKVKPSDRKLPRKV